MWIEILNSHLTSSEKCFHFFLFFSGTKERFFLGERRDQEKILSQMGRGKVSEDSFPDEGRALSPNGTLPGSILLPKILLYGK